MSPPPSPSSLRSFVFACVEILSHKFRLELGITTLGRISCLQDRRDSVTRETVFGQDERIREQAYTSGGGGFSLRSDWRCRVSTT